MQFFPEIFVTLLGIVLGSFLNVLVLRYNTGRGVLGRSTCFSCGKNLEWYELVPVLSFLFLRGKCSVCQSKISIQYPLVEIISGLLFLFSFRAAASIPEFVLLALISYLWLFVGVYDMLHKMIPRSIVWSANLLSLIFVLLFHMEPLFSILAAVLGTLPLFLIWFFSKGKAMGLGDSELFLGLGLLSGFAGVFSALAFSFWIGALISLLYLGLTRLRGTSGRVTMKSEIPFGPFLILGSLLVIYFHYNALSLFNFL